MANDFDGAVIVFDTAGASSAFGKQAIVSGFLWDSGDSGAVGDNVVLHDAASGKVVFQATLAVGKDTISFSPAAPIPVKGLYLTTLDNGKLLVYLK